MITDKLMTIEVGFCPCSDEICAEAIFHGSLLNGYRFAGSGKNAQEALINILKCAAKQQEEILAHHITTNEIKRIQEQSKTQHE